MRPDTKGDSCGTVAGKKGIFCFKAQKKGDPIQRIGYPIWAQNSRGDMFRLMGEGKDRPAAK